MMNLNLEKITDKFFLKSTLDVARELIGMYLMRTINSEKVIVQITETEAYIGSIDKACHAYKNKITDRTKPFYLKSGTIYIYLIYGMYHCFNIVTEKEGIAAAVLIRAATPIFNVELMSRLRYSKDFEKLSKYEKKNFLNGPGKLCKALAIDKSFNNKDIFGDEIYLMENKEFDNSNIKVGKRINIDYAEEAKDFLWRFYL